MRGETDQYVGADYSPHRLDRLVVLADVHAVRVAGESKVGAVVDDQQRAVRVAQLTQLAAGGHYLVVGGVLLAQLHHVHPAGQRRRNHGARGPASITR